jgi:hypothetical protein
VVKLKRGKDRYIGWERRSPDIYPPFRLQRLDASEPQQGYQTKTRSE